jgi:phage gpG-like protein
MKQFDLDKILRKLQTKQLMREIGKVVLKDTNENFANEGFGGKKWKARKSFKYEDEHPISNKTGSLKNSIKILSVDKNDVVVGTEKEYGWVHNDGTDEIPQRQFIGNNEKQEKEIINLLEQELDKLFN